MVRLSEDEWDAVQAAPPTSYSLGGSGLDRIATMEPRISDGLGHWWDSASQSWQNDSGGAYQANDYSADPGLGVYGDQSYSAPTSYSLNSPQLDQIATTYAGPTWVDNGTPGGKYVDQWGNESYDGGNTWVSPGQMQPPAFAPDSWSQPQPQPDNYSLGFGGTAFDSYGNQGVQNPWDTRLNPQQDSGGGFWGGVKDFAGDVGKGALTTLGAAREYVGEPIFGTLSGLSDSERQPIYDPQGNIIGYTRDPGLLDYPKDLGGALKRTFADPVEQYKRAKQGSDEYFNNPENSPYWNAVGQVAIDPLSYVGPGLASKVIPDSVPAAGAIRGLLDQGGGGAVLGGAVGGTFGASDTAEKIPGFGDQPDWLRGIEGGVIGGLAGAGAAGSLKATAAAGSPRLSFTGEVGSASTPEEFNPARRQLLDALDAERKFRESGVADNLIHEGRVTQAKGIGDATGNLGDSFAENAANIRAGARTGSMLPSTQGLGLDDSTLNQLLKEAVDYNGGKQFDNLRAVKALDKLNNGQRLQPAEIKALRQIYGDEIADAVAKTNPQRIQTIAELTPEDISKINRMAEVDGKKVATLEVQAQRQHELADDLVKQSRMDPTNPRLKKAAEEARARALKQQNDADRILADRAEQYTANLPQRTEAGIISGETSKLGSLDDALRRDKRLAAQEAAVRKAAEDDWVRSLDPQGPDEYALRQARYERNSERSLSAAQEAAKKAAGDKASAEWARALGYDQPDAYAKTFAGDQARAQRDLGRLQDRALAKQTDRRATREFTESGQKAMADAEKVIDKLDVSPAMKQAQKDSVAIWLKQNERILDTLGDDGPGLFRRAYAAYSGEVTDSWTSQLISRRRALESALESQGMSREAAAAVGKFVQEAEIKRRFGADVPSWVTDSVDQAKGVERDAAGKVIDRPGKPGGSATIIDSAAIYSQEFKNTAFGIGDVAAFGQNGIHLLNTNAVQFLSGLANRLANMANLGFDTRAVGEDLIGKRAAKALDGLSHSGSTGIVDASNGTLLRHIPGLSVVDRKVIMPAINALTDLQFKHVLGWMRDVNYEGNLVLAKMAGADITDPVVRARAAEWANAASGAGKLAQRANRANLEKASILSASMTRAQAQQIGQVGRGLTSGTRVDRVLAAATIVSTVGTTLGIGKLLNDWIGTADFEFDPSKKGFGNIRLGDGTTVNLFSQTQVPKVLAQSLGVLARDGFTKDDLTELGKAWGNFGMGRSSPALRLGEAAVGLGYEPGRGYRYGDYMEGKSFTDRLASQLPIPPIATQTKQDGFGKILTPANIAGVNAFPESDYQKRLRTLGPNPTEKELFDYGRVYSTDPKIRAQQEAADKVYAEQTARQQARDTELTTGPWTPAKAAKWRDQRKLDGEYFAGRFDEIYGNSDYIDKNPSPVDIYNKAIRDNTDPVTGDVNWYAVDQATKGLDKEYIKANTNLRDTSIERSYSEARDKIEASGYFNREEQTWAKVQKYSEEAKGYPDYYAWKDAKLQAQTQKFMDRYGYDQLYAAAMAEKAVNASAPEQIYDGYSKQWKVEWVKANPDAAYQAWTWGYYTPTDDMKAYLNKWAKGQ